MKQLLGIFLLITLLGCTAYIHSQARIPVSAQDRLNCHNEKEQNYEIIDTETSEVDLKQLSSAYQNGQRLYFYHSTTLQEVRNLLGLEESEFQSPMYDIHGNTVTNSFYTVDELAEFDIVGIGKNQSIYLAKLPRELALNNNYIQQQIQTYEEWKQNASHFSYYDIASIDAHGNNVFLNFQVLKDSEELVSDYDFYSINTAASIIDHSPHLYSPYGIFIKCHKTQEENQLVDYWPQSSIKSVTIGSEGIKVSEFNDGIKTKSSLSQDYVSWSAKKPYINKEIKTKSTWAVEPLESGYINLKCYGNIMHHNVGVETTEPMSFGIIFVNR